MYAVSINSKEAEDRLISGATFLFSTKEAMDAFLNAMCLAYGFQAVILVSDGQSVTEFNPRG